MARILIIDDDDRFRDMLQDMMERNGYEVVSASDGKEGIDLYRKEPTDLVITDIIMPNKEGVETMFELQRDFPDVKIIESSKDRSFNNTFGNVTNLHLLKKRSKCINYKRKWGIENTT